MRTGVDLGVVILAAVFTAAWGDERVEGAWWAELCRDGRLGRRDPDARGSRRGVQGRAEWLLWLGDGCLRAAARIRGTGRRAQRQRGRLRARAARLRVRARAAVRSAHHRIASHITSHADEVVIGDLDVVDLGRGRRGRNNRRLRFCGPARLRDDIVRAGKARGVAVSIMDESGTTGTCPWCLTYRKHGSEVCVLAPARSC